MRAPHLETSQTRASTAAVSSAIASKAPGTAGVRSMSAVVPLKKEVSPGPAPPEMITLPMSIPIRCSIPSRLPRSSIGRNYSLDRQL